MAFSLTAQSGATRSRNVFFSLAAGGLDSLLRGGGNSDMGMFSLYESGLEETLWWMCCWFW